MHSITDGSSGTYFFFGGHVWRAASELLQAITNDFSILKTNLSAPGKKCEE